jgi:DNA-binding transcriptional LysR family regulator
MLDWDALRIFLAVAESGSLSAASRRLRISQPTVSRRIAALEEEMATRLFDRAGRALRPTEAAAALLEPARRMALEADAAVRRLSGQDRELTGLVRLSTTEGLGARWLPSRLRSLRDELAGIDVELVIDNAAVNLSRGESDLALRLPKHGVVGQQALVGRKLGLLEFGLYAAPDYIARRGAPRHAAELAAHDIVAPPDSLRVAPHYDWLVTLAPDARRAFRSNSLVAQIEGARAGLGVALIARIHAEGDAALSRVLPDLAPQPPEVWILYHADMRRNARVRAVADWLAALVRREPFLLEESATRR